MPGQINAIWLTQPNGNLHPQIVPKLREWQSEAKDSDFKVVLWTNIKELNPQEIEKVTAEKIIVRDCSECEASKFYTYFTNFLEKGINGDTTAFALASDILRMSILELAQEKECYVYADANDIEFIEFKKYLQKLHQYLLSTPMGFACSVRPENENTIEVRNDVLVALKQKNPQFFTDYFNAYELHLKNTYQNYVKPANEEKAQAIAKDISNQTSHHFFTSKGFIKARHFKLSDGSLKEIPRMPVMSAEFGKYSVPYLAMDLTACLPYRRDLANANTWIPSNHKKSI